MVLESRHLSTRIDRPVQEVYEYAANPVNLAEWASGLGSAPEPVGDHWVVKTPEGDARVDFAPRNEFGVVDHHVTTPAGETIYVPLRVIADGNGSEVVFTVRRLPAMTDADFDQDAAAVAADLASLKEILERS